MATPNQFPVYERSKTISVGTWAFKKEIGIGNLLTIVMVLISLFMWLLDYRDRIVRLEQWQEQEKADMLEVAKSVDILNKEANKLLAKLAEFPPHRHVGDGLIVYPYTRTSGEWDDPPLDERKPTQSNLPGKSPKRYKAK